MSKSKVQHVLALARSAGVLRPRDLEPHGIHREYLRRLEQQGLLTRSGRDIYTLLEADFTEHHSLVQANQCVPHGIVCLLSALRFHEITTQAPFEVWLAIHGKAHTPREKLIPLHIVHMSGKAFESGIETYQLEGIPVQIYNLPKTVADCFKYRNKIGLDVALEALRESWRDRRCTIDELWHYAKICRVSNVMRPYLESLTSMTYQSRQTD
jgi:predicted transcriptional regulator of viral defense system